MNRRACVALLVHTLLASSLFAAEPTIIDRNLLAPHLKAATEARAKKDYDAAIAHLNEALKIAPRDAATINGLAGMNMRKGA